MPVDWLAARAAVTPEALALLFEGQAWTYARLDALVDRLAARLAAAGVDRDTHVGILMENRPEAVWLIHAVARRGAVLVPLNTRLTAAELAWQVARADCGMIVCSAATLTQARAVSGLDFDLRLFCIDSVDADAAPLPPAAEAVAHAGYATDDVQAIIFTSGTTGRPKGVMLTFANHRAGATASAYRLGVLPHDRWLACLPLYHVGGLAIVLRSCLYGTAIVLHRRFDTATVATSLSRDGVTLVSLVPTMVVRLLDHLGQAPWPAALRHVLVGGAATSAELVDRCAALGIPLSTTYGLTEAASQVATLTPDGVRHKPGCVGKPLLFTTVSIVDPDSGAPCPTGAVGEIVVAGPTVMRGYYHEPVATASALDDGRLHTGDMGYLDADSDLWVVQRRSDIIVTGGENVYPAEVEQALGAHPAVAAIAVAGVSDPEWGQRVAALVVVRPGGALDAAALKSFGRARLAGYKLPRLIHFVDALPLTASGKVDRRRVQTELQEAWLRGDR